MTGVVLVLVSVAVGCALPLFGIDWIWQGPAQSMTPYLHVMEISVRRSVALPLLALVTVGLVLIFMPRRESPGK
jgi:ABC-type branched-subunit amino acid transport system permease subunit